MPCLQPQPCPAECNADHHSTEIFSQALTKFPCNSGHSERKVMALSWSSKMSALAEEGPGQSICRVVMATPLQTYNIHLTEYICGVGVKPFLLAGPRLSSCPVHKDSTCTTKIHHYLPWHQTAAERMQWQWGDEGGGSGAIVRVSLKNLPEVFLEGMHDWRQIFPLISVLAIGLKGLPTLAFQSAGKEDGFMEGKPHCFVMARIRTFPAFNFSQIFFLVLLSHLTEPMCSFIL